MVSPSKHGSSTGPCSVCTATATAVGTVRVPTVDTLEAAPIRDPVDAGVKSWTAVSGWGCTRYCENFITLKVSLTKFNAQTTGKNVML